MALVPIHRRVTHFWRAFFGGVFLFCAFAALVIIVYNASMPPKNSEELRADARLQKLAALRADDEAKLNSYRWINKQKGTVQIPIEQAMELVLVDLRSKTPRASNVKVEHPYPAGLQDLPAVPAAVSGSNAAIPAASAAPATDTAPASPSPSPSPSPATQAMRVLPVSTPKPPAPSPKPKAKRATGRQPFWDWDSRKPAASPTPKK